MSIHVKILRFKCWHELELDLPLGQVTYIKGVNGSGKTTLFEAISWAMHGGNAKITPFKEDTAETVVELTFPHLVIRRQRAPKALTVRTAAGTYIDKEAQAIIDRTYGENKTWLASCYISLFYRNSFSTLTDKEKLKVLTEIAFHEQDPQSKIDVIQNAIVKIEPLVTKTFDTYNGKVQQLQLMAAKVDLTKALNPLAVVKLEGFIKTYTAKVQELQVQLQEYQVQTRLLNSHQQQLRTWQTKVITMPQLPAELQVYQDIIPQTVEELRSHLPQLQRLHDLECDMQRYASLVCTTSYTPEDLNAALSVEHSRQQMLATLKSLGLLESQYTMSAINTAVAQRQSQLDAQTALTTQTTNLPVLVQQAAHLKEQLAQYTTHIQEVRAAHSTLQAKAVNPQVVQAEHQKLQAELAAATAQVTKLQQWVAPTPVVPPPPAAPVPVDIALSVQYQERTTQLSTEIGQLSSHIQQLEANKDIVPCPHCAGPLRYQQNRIVSADAPVLNVHELTEAMTKRTQLYAQLAAVQQQLTALNTALLAYNTAVKAEQEYAVVVQRATEAVTRAITQHQTSVAAAEANVLRLTDQVAHKAEQVATVTQVYTEVTAELGVLQAKISALQAEQQPVQAQLAAVNTEVVALQKIQQQILTPAQVQSITGVIAQLQAIVVIASPPVSSTAINAGLELQKQQILKEEAVAKYWAYRATLPYITNQDPAATVYAQTEQQILALTTYVAQHQQALADEVTKGQRIVEFEAHVKSVVVGKDTTPAIAHYQAQITGWQTQLRQHVAATEVLKYNELLVAEKVNVDALAAKLVNYRNLLQTAVSCRYQILMAAVKNINLHIDSVCNSMFPQSISMGINLFKKLKSNSVVKPKVNFEIEYNGCKYTNITEMSGGEEARTLMAVTLALHRLSNCPLLMMDETLGNIDTVTQDYAIKTIRRNTTGAVLVAAHAMPEGVYDHVVDLWHHQHQRVMY